MIIRQYPIEIHGVLLLAGGVAGYLAGSVVVFNVFALASFILLIAAGRRSIQGFVPPGGLANWITGGRFVILLMASTFYEQFGPRLFAVLVIVSILADAADGWVARKRGEATRFGALFDMETDAYLAASLSMLLYLFYDVTALVLIPGFLRYLFIIVMRIAGWYRLGRVSFAEARVLAFLFFVSLLVPFVIDWKIARWVLLAGSLGVTYSFIKEGVLYYRLKKATRSSDERRVTDRA